MRFRRNNLQHLLEDAHKKVSSRASAVLRHHITTAFRKRHETPLHTAQVIGQLPDVGERSRLRFNLLMIQPDFLLTSEWRASPEYESACKSLRNISPLNDSKERALALATNLNTKIARTVESYQDSRSPASGG